MRLLEEIAGLLGDPKMKGRPWQKGRNLTMTESDMYMQDIKAQEIQSTFTFETFEMVRRELFAHTRATQMTIHEDGIQFNQACINALEDAVYIQVMVSREQKRIAIRKCEEDDKDAIRWCTVKSGNRKSRKVTGRKFSDMIFELMGWESGHRYKLLGHHIVYQGQDLFIFELPEAEMHKVTPRRTKAEKEQMAKTMTPEQITEQRRAEAKAARVAYEPEQFRGLFGVPVNEHQDKVQLQSLDGFTSGADLIHKPAAQPFESYSQDPVLDGQR